MFHYETECAKLIHGRVKASNEEIFDSIRGFEILSEQRFKMSHAKQHMELLSSYMDDIETELFRLSRSYDEVIKRISGIVGFTERSALFVISEIGADMGVFESAKHLCSWAGLTPANNEYNGYLINILFITIDFFLRNFIHFVLPMINNRFFIHLIKILIYSIYKFLFAIYTNAT